MQTKSINPRSQSPPRETVNCITIYTIKTNGGNKNEWTNNAKRSRK